MESELTPLKWRYLTQSMRKTYLKQKQTSFATADIYQMVDFFNMITIIHFFLFYKYCV